MEGEIYLAGFLFAAVLLVYEFSRNWKLARSVLPKVRRVPALTESERIQTIYEARRETQQLWSRSLSAFACIYLPLTGALIIFRGPLDWTVAFTALLFLQAFLVWVSGNHDTIVKLATDRMSAEERRSLLEYAKKRQPRG